MERHAEVVLPQRAQSPEKVATFLTDHPALGPFLDRIGMFDTYTSVWFSAIYLLLFLSASGIYLWAVLRSERSAGLALLCAGVLSFLGAVYALVH